MNTTELIHNPMMEYWKREYEEYEKERYKIYTRFDVAEGKHGVSEKTKGDQLLEEVNDLFFNGFGISWSPVQIKIWNAIVDAALPLIYGSEWEEVKSRVLKQRNLTKVHLELFINMARRNGKTWIVSGACVVFFLKLRSIATLVFSVGKRQSGFFLGSCVEKIKAAFTFAKNIKASDYKTVAKNQELIIFEFPDTTKNSISSLPGSISVS